MPNEIFSDEFFASMDSSILDVNQARMLPPKCYSDPRFFEFEKEAVFSHDWLCVGREACPNQNCNHRGNDPQLLPAGCFNHFSSGGLSLPVSSGVRLEIEFYSSRALDVYVKPVIGLL